MQRRKLLTEYSVEELSEVANDETQDIIIDTKDRQSSMLLFIHNYGLKPGEELIKFKRLYDLYKITTNSPDPLNYLQFLNDIKQHFQTERRGRNYYLLVNKKSINLSKEVHRQLLETNRIHKPRKKDGYFQKQFNEFKTLINLQPGKSYIKRSVIYYFYDLWAFNNKKKRMSQETLYNLLNKEGLVVRHNTLWSCVRINKEVFTPYEKTIEEAAAWVKKRYKAKKD